MFFLIQTNFGNTFRDNLLMMTLSVFECIIRADLLHQLWVVVVHDMNLCRGFIRDALFI